MDPVTMAIIAAAVASTASAGSQAFRSHREKKEAKKSTERRAKESKRETYGDLLNQAQSRQAELNASRMASEGRLGKSKARSMMDTAANMRGSLGI